MASTIKAGYKCKWIKKPSTELKCLICLNVARDPQQHGGSGCGKLLCSSCVIEYILNTKNTCPDCKEPLTNEIFKDERSARHIKDLKVECDNIDNGCKWVATLEYLEEHLTTCSYTPIPCTNKCKNGNETVKVLRKDLRDHLANKCPRRQYPCPHCKEKGEYQERTTTHLEICPKVKVQCPNVQCPDSIPRCEVTTHRSTCDYEPVSCKYAEVGCEERPERKDLKKHEENDQLHLRITTERVLQLKKDIADLNTEVLKSTSKPQFSFRLTNCQQHKKDDDIYYSDPFYTFHTGYKMCICVDANGHGDGAGKGTHVSVFACLMKGDNDDSLTWPFTGTVTVELLNQLEDDNHHKKTITFIADIVNSMDGERGGGWGYWKFIPHADLDYKPDNNCQYLKDDKLIFRISVQVPDYKPWLECDV